jgi:hypothetical protein
MDITTIANSALLLADISRPQPSKANGYNLDRYFHPDIEEKHACCHLCVHWALILDNAMLIGVDPRGSRAI